MLTLLAPDIWHITRHFKASGMPLSSRMTVVRLQDGGLWLHSPVALRPAELEEIRQLGPVRFIVAPNKVHHLFVSPCAAAFPQARVFGAPGLARKRADLPGMTELRTAPEPEWSADLDQVFVEGVPVLNETVWFHKSSRTLIATDFCQCWAGELPVMASLYARVTGVRGKLAVPRTVRLMVRDRQAVRASAERILGWPIERILTAHNSLVGEGAHAALVRAFRVFGV